jgi:hypothetical protein
MSRATPEMRSFARRLIALDGKGGQSSEAKLPVAFQVCEKLRPHFGTLMGKAGFRALLSRALVVAHAEVPHLHVLQVNASGSVEGLEELEARVDSEGINEAGVVLVAHLLGLLVAFIGENLTMRLVGEVWPKLSVNDLDIRKKEIK